MEPLSQKRNRLASYATSIALGKGRLHLARQVPMAPSMENAEETALQGIVIPAHDEQVVPTPVLHKVMPTEADLKNRALEERGVCGYERRSPRRVVRTVARLEGLAWHCRPSVQQVRVVTMSTHACLECLECPFSHGRVTVESFELFRRNARIGAVQACRQRPRRTRAAA